MASKLQQELKQNKPFGSLREELLLNLSRTAAAMNHHWEQTIRPYGLSATQYNVLRILRGAGSSGLCQYEIGERLVAQVPDVPRILERMEKAGWVLRLRATSDRRMVVTSLSEQGLQLVNDLDAPASTALHMLFPDMSDDEMHRFNELLVAARQPICQARAAAVPLADSPSEPTAE